MNNPLWGDVAIFGLLHDHIITAHTTLDDLNVSYPYDLTHWKYCIVCAVCKDCKDSGHITLVIVSNCRLAQSDGDGHHYDYQQQQI
jgi:hypothetical protein